MPALVGVRDLVGLLVGVFVNTFVADGFPGFLVAVRVAVLTVVAFIVAVLARVADANGVEVNRGGTVRDGATVRVTVAVLVGGSGTSVGVTQVGAFRPIMNKAPSNAPIYSLL